MGRDGSAKSQTKTESQAQVGNVHRKMSAVDSSSATTVSTSGTSSSIDSETSLFHWLMPSSQSQSDRGHDAEYTQCLNAYAGLVASSQIDSSSAISAGSGRVSSPVLYSTYKATAARELLCW